MNGFTVSLIWIGCGLVSWPLYFYLFFCLPRKQMTKYEIKTKANDIFFPCLISGVFALLLFLPILFIRVTYLIVFGYNNNNNEKTLTLFERIVGEDNITR